MAKGNVAHIAEAPVTNDNLKGSTVNCLFWAMEGLAVLADVEAVCLK